MFTHQLRDAAPFIPVLDVDVSFVVEAATVRGGKHTVLPLLRWHPEFSTLIGVWTQSQTLAQVQAQQAISMLDSDAQLDTSASE